MPDVQDNAVVESGNVVASQDGEIVVTLNSDQLEQLVGAIKDNHPPDYHPELKKLLLANETKDGTAPAVLTQEQYDGIMTVGSSLCVADVVLVALLVLVIGLLFAQLLTKRWVS